MLTRSDTDAIIFALAAGQHGVVSRRQLLQAGVSPDRVDGRLKIGRLERLHRGVYRVGPVVAQYANEMAAVLACDGKVVVSHRSAAPPWKLMSARGAGSAVEVIVPHSDHGRMPNIVAHRLRGIRCDEVTKFEGIPITTPARTLLDIAGLVSSRDLERAVAEAFAMRLATRADLIRLMSRHPRQRGTAALRALLGSAQPALTRSEAEDRFLALVRKARLPAPETNVQIGDYEVDFLWRAERFIVEIDGYAFHSSAERFEKDRQRDAVLAATGLRVIRVTWRQLQNDSHAMLVRLAQALVRTNML